MTATTLRQIFLLCLDLGNHGVIFSARAWVGTGDQYLGKAQSEGWSGGMN